MTFSRVGIAIALIKAGIKVPEGETLIIVTLPRPGGINHHYSLDMVKYYCRRGDLAKAGSPVLKQRMDSRKADVPQ